MTPESSHKPKDIIRFLPELFRILSFDVALGTVAGGCLVSKFLHVNMPLLWWFVLPGTVWLIYTCDHLIDSLKVGSKAYTKRHLFHYRNRRVLSVVMILTGSLILILSLYCFSMPVIKFGLITGLAVLVYLVLISYFNKHFISKEVFVAIVYTTGIWGVPVLMHDFSLTPVQWLATGVFAGIALLNLLIFSYYEYDIDQKSGFHSFATKLGISKSKKLIFYLFFVVFMAVFSMVLLCHASLCYKTGGLFLVMTTILWLVFAYPGLFTAKNLYRKLGDGIFLLQFLALLF